MIPGHLRPVILKPVGRIFEISDSNPIQGTCGKCGRSLTPQKNRGLRRFHRTKTRKTRKMRTPKRGKCGKCAWLALLWLALGDPQWYFPAKFAIRNAFVLFTIRSETGAWTQTLGSSCPWDGPGLSQGHPQAYLFSVCYAVEAQFVPGTSPVGPWDKPKVEGRQKEFTITHKRITEPNFIIVELFSVAPALWLPNRIFLELLCPGKKSEQRITESLTELFWELYSVICVEELPNRNCFGINSVIFLCVMVCVRSLCAFFTCYVRWRVPAAHLPPSSLNLRVCVHDTRFLKNWGLLCWKASYGISLQGAFPAASSHGPHWRISTLQACWVGREREREESSTNSDAQEVRAQDLLSDFCAVSSESEGVYNSGVSGTPPVFSEEIDRKTLWMLITKQIWGMGEGCSSLQHKNPRTESGRLPFQCGSKVQSRLTVPEALWLKAFPTVCTTKITELTSSVSPIITAPKIYRSDIYRPRGPPEPVRLRACRGVLTAPVCIENPYLDCRKNPLLSVDLKGARM